MQLTYGVEVTAHPRRCGENSGSFAMYLSIFGSSPQVRGKHPRAAKSNTSARLIPAGAGKTLISSPVHLPRQAHPRRCGENSHLYFSSRFRVGSSPQVRGKRGCGKDIWLRRRLIPAGAGKTSSPRRSRRRAAAHPRRCGENIPCSRAISTDSGSSPQVRGKLPNRTAAKCTHRLIPAGAGKT